MRLFLLGFSLFALASCGESGGAEIDPRCADARCGENAHCVIENEQPICRCDAAMMGDGEVCDRSGAFVQHLVGAQADAIYVTTADIDADGDRDVLATSSDHGATYRAEVAWYENAGQGAAFTKHVISPVDAAEPVYAANGVAVADFDLDGRLDVVVASGPMGNGPGAIHFFRGPALPTGAWEHRTLASDAGQTFFKIYAADLTGDGFPDVVAGGSLAGLILVNSGSLDTGFAPHAMSAGTGVGIYLVDLDGDGALDILSANPSYGRVTWTRPVWTGTAFQFEDQTLATLEMPFDVNVTDANRDGRLDVVCSRIAGPALRWLEQPAQTDGSWAEHMIRADFSATDLYPGDIDRDGQEEMVAAGLAMMAPNTDPTSIVWFKPQGTSGSIEWQQHWIDYDNPNLKAPGDLELADLDGDGSLDVVTTSMKDDAVYWYENRL